MINLKKRFKGLTTIILIGVLAMSMCFTACTKKPEVLEKSKTEQGSNEKDSKFMKVENSSAFSVEYLENDVKVVTDGEGRKFLLVPKEGQVPEGHKDATVIRTPVENVLFCSATQVGMIRPLDLWDKIGGVTQEKGSWPFPEIEEGLNNGNITFVGKSSEPDYEKIQDLNPDITFVYTGTYPQTGIINKLEELGLPYAVDNEYMESKHTGRMEWIKFLATFFNEDDKAVQYVDRQIKDLEEMHDKVKDANKPKVVWGSIKDGIVYVPGPESYVAEAVKTAGGEYLVPEIKGSGSSQISVEEFYQLLQEADIFMYSSNKKYVPDYKALSELAPVIGDAPVVKDKQVWQFSVDYYMDTDKADEQVIDLAAILHPELFKDYKIKHYNALAE
jgi:iron complex transport system substrate-binding protein